MHLRSQELYIAPYSFSVIIYIEKFLHYGQTSYNIKPITLLYIGAESIILSLMCPFFGGSTVL